MSLSPRRSRPIAADPGPALGAMSLVVAAVALSRDAASQLLPSDILTGALLVAAVLALRALPMPNVAARVALAIAMGHGLWLILAGAAFALAGLPGPGPSLLALFEWIETAVPADYWAALGWALLSVLSLPIAARREPRA